MPKKDTSWGNVADWYNDLLEEGKDTYQEKVIGPNLIRLLKDFVGKDVVDIACGAGYFSRMFQKTGLKVSGVDIAPELIEQAKKISVDTSITYSVSPADKLPYREHSFDVATIVLALQNIENVKGVFEEASRVLKSQASFFVILNHPSFRIPKLSSWGFDEKENKQYRRVDGYLSESKVEIDMHPGSKDGEKTISFHRPLQYYSKLLYNSGFVIKRIEEWESHKKSEPGKRAHEENRIRKEIPMFLCLEAVKQ